MKILRYRTIAEVYPYLTLEAEIFLENGDTVYTNISVNDKGEQETCLEDSHWTYSKPLTEIDWENPEDYYYDLSEAEEEYVCSKLLDFWNNNPVFDNDYAWKPFLE